MEGGVERCQEIADFGGVQPSIDIHGNTVVMVYHSRVQCELKSLVGTINEGRTTISWGEEVSLEAKGIYPSISLNAQGSNLKASTTYPSSARLRVGYTLQKWLK